MRRLFSWFRHWSNRRLDREILEQDVERERVARLDQIADDIDDQLRRERAAFIESDDAWLFDHHWPAPPPEEEP